VNRIVTWDTLIDKSRSVNSKCDFQSQVELLKPATTGILFQPFLRPNADLSAKSIMLRMDGGADKRRKSRINERGVCYNDEDLLSSWIPGARAWNYVELAAFLGNR
jgi:hypothetical protein